MVIIVRLFLQELLGSFVATNLQGNTELQQAATDGHEKINYKVFIDFLNFYLSGRTYETLARGK